MNTRIFGKTEFDEAMKVYYEILDDEYSEMYPPYEQYEYYKCDCYECSHEIYDDEPEYDYRFLKNVPSKDIDEEVNYEKALEVLKLTNKKIGMNELMAFTKFLNIHKIIFNTDNLYFKQMISTML
jgi:hypothetical protein